MQRAMIVVLFVLTDLVMGSWSSTILPKDSLGANTYFVATDGSDANPGSLLHPWRTIYKAANSVHGGDTVYIRGGIYQESNIFYPSGTESAPIVIAGYRGETAIIDGYWYTFPAKSSGGALLQVYGDWYTIRDLTVTRSGDQGVTAHGSHDTIDHVYSHHNWGWGILMTGDYDVAQNSYAWSNSMVNENLMDAADESGGITCARYPAHCTIRANRSWENWGEGISTFESMDTTIESNTASDNETDIYISDTKFARVSRNFVYCSSGNAIGALQEQTGILVGDELGVPIPLGPGGTRNPSSDNSFLNNIVMGCDNNLFATQNQAANNLYAFNTFVNSDGTRPYYTADVQFGSGTASNQRFVNNLLYQNGTIGIIQVDQPGIIAFSHNLWSKAPPDSFHATGLTDVIGNPRMVMAGSPYDPSWYMLTVSSPAIGAGMTLADTNLDYFGRDRGLTPAMGALEYFPFNSADSIFLPLVLR